MSCVQCKETIAPGVDFMEHGDLKIHSACIPAWEKEQKGGSGDGGGPAVGDCIHCGGAISDNQFLEKGNRRLHKSCWDDYLAAQKGTCVHCGKGIEKQYVSHGDKRIHPECKEAYIAATHDECSQCGKVLEGEVVELSSAPGKSFHEGCVEAYKQATRPKCNKCDQVILEAKYLQDSKGNAFHESCANSG